MTDAAPICTTRVALAYFALHSVGMNGRAKRCVIHSTRRICTIAPRDALSHPRHAQYPHLLPAPQKSAWQS